MPSKSDKGRVIRLKTPDSQRPLEQSVLVRPVKRLSKDDLQKARLKRSAETQRAELEKRGQDNLYCAKCGLLFSWVSGGFGVHHYYALDNAEKIPVLETSSYCLTCNQMTLAEYLSVKDAIQHLSLVATRQAELLDEIARRSGNVIARLLTSEKRIAALHAAEGLLSDEYEQWNRHITMLENRRAPPKCLTCGSSNLYEFDKPFASSPSESTEHHAHHPRCGGLLYIEPGPDILAHGIRVERVYSVDGEFLYENTIGDF